MKTTRKLLFELEDEVYACRLAEVYGSDQADAQTARCLDAIRRYEKYFGEGEVALFSAPGRVELGGSCTEQQNGEVLAAAIDRDVMAVAGYSEDRMVRVFSEGYDLIEFDPRDLHRKEGETGTAAALVRGVLAGFRARGMEVDGFHAYITTTLRPEEGFAASAAFEILIAAVVSGLFHEDKVSAELCAEIGQYAENVYFDKPCGISDQLISAAGGLCHLDFAKPGTPKLERVPCDLSQYGYVLCSTAVGVEAEVAAAERTAIPREMYAVAAHLGKRSLRTVTIPELMIEAESLRGTVGDRAFLRALHFLLERRRVHLEKQALKEKNFEAFLEIVRRSGESAHKYLQNACPCGEAERQAMNVALAVGETVFGSGGICRVQGSGFGAVQAFVKCGAVPRYKAAMENLFGAGACTVLRIRTYGGGVLL